MVTSIFFSTSGLGPATASQTDSLAAGNRLKVAQARSADRGRRCRGGWRRPGRRPHRPRAAARKRSGLACRRSSRERGRTRLSPRTCKTTSTWQGSGVPLEVLTTVPWIVPATAALGTAASQGGAEQDGRELHGRVLEGHFQVLDTTTITRPVVAATVVFRTVPARPRPYVANGVVRRPVAAGMPIRRTRQPGKQS